MPVATLSSGVDACHEVAGSGDPLLLITGTAAGHSPWEARVEAYRDHYTVVAYDARGAGQSTRLEDNSPYSVMILADDAAALLDSSGIEKVYISGLSLGSATAQERASNHPDKVASLQPHFPTVAAFGPGLLPRAQSPNEYMAVAGVTEAARSYTFTAVGYLRGKP